MRAAKFSFSILIPLAMGLNLPAAEPLADMLKKAPEQANTLLFIDVKGLVNSAMGVKNNWNKQHERDYYAGVSGVPPAVQQILVASYLDPSTLQKNWDVEVLRLDTPITAEQLARKEQGQIDATNADIVVSPRNAFFTIFEPTLVGARSPANRQEMIRWQRFAGRKNAEPAVSPFLQEAAKAAEGKHLFLAIDVTDVPDAPGVRQRLKNATTLIGRKVNLDELTKLFVGLKGVSLTVKADAALEGELRVEFSMAANDLAAFGRALTMEVLEHAGLSVEDMDKWDQRIDGNALVLHGKFTEKGLRGLIMPLMPTVLSPAESLGKKATSTDPKVQASLKYFHSITGMLDELQDGKNNRSLSRISYLYGEYARKIDDLPILDVDPDLLKYSAAVSTTIREIGNQSRLQGRTNTALSANIVEGVAQVPNAYNYYGGGYGWGYNFSAPGYEWQSNRQQITNMMASGNLTESARRHETWKNINAATVKVKQDMVAKYNVEF
jgi:hypothetical protein